ncbi:MAG: hypothetical protein ACK2UW_08175 [Anaerolineales bacterium]|jgi:hypothetical protein
MTKAPAKKHAKHKERGTLLVILLVVMALHGIIAAFAYYSMINNPATDRNLVVALMVIHSLANVIAAVGIWYWKKWALYLYAASTVLALIAGLISVGIWSVFYMVLPLAIVGWVLRTKWSYFE